MSGLLERADRFFDTRLTWRSRTLALIAAAVLLLAYWFPLWTMRFYSNQFLDGLALNIYSHRLEGGKTANRDDLREINTLNHYIGMRPLQESDFSEFIWLPLAISGIMLLGLRATVLGRMADLVDVLGAYAYFGLYSLWSFYHRLYTYGHQLEPTAAIKVDPFTPPLIGMKVIGNFTVYSLPNVASFALMAFSLLMLGAVFLSMNPRKRAST